MNQRVTCFCCLFPHLRNEGIYLIEDFYTSYWCSHGGGKHPNTTLAFLKNHIDEVKYIGATTTKVSHLGIMPCTSGPNYYRENIFSTHYYDNLVVIL